MPFKSAKQRGYLFANHPEVAREFAKAEKRKKDRERMRRKRKAAAARRKP